MKKHFCNILFLIIFFTPNLFAQNNEDNLLQFIAKNKSRAAVYFTENDSVLVKINEIKMMPLASAVKILVAIEYAKQVAKNNISEGDMVALTELERYYIPNTDGDAHPNWLAYEKNNNHIIGDSIQLLDVARGMMMYSSNANTEYLMELLGLDNINSNINILGLKNHTALYPLVASLFMYQSPRKNTEKEILKGIKKLSEEQYCRFIYDMHKALAYDTLLKQKYKPEQFTANMQQVWSQRLPASSAKDYGKIANILNNRSYFDEETYRALSPILETIMENTNNKQWLKHAGMKGGSTAWVLTKVLYATTKKGKRIELVYFFNNLTLQENGMIKEWMNSFELSILNNNDFKIKMMNTLK